MGYGPRLKIKYEEGSRLAFTCSRESLVAVECDVSKAPEGEGFEWPAELEISKDMSRKNYPSYVKQAQRTYEVDKVLDAKREPSKAGGRPRFTGAASIMPETPATASATPPRTYHK
jgi:hypothetical protein